MLNNNKVGIAVGSFLALFHAVWAILIALGVAQAVLDFVFYLHMIESPYLVAEFDLSLAVGLVIFTGIVGYVIGWIFSYVCNWAHR